MSSPSPVVVEISKCLVKPSSLPDSAHNRIHLAPLDVALLSVNYIQKGLLFSNLPPGFSINSIIDHLKSSLSVALSHFYPVAGRLVTERVLTDNNEVSGMIVSISCNNQGAEFIHAVANNLTVADVLAPSDDVPAFVRSFFLYNGAINHDGHSLPLLAVQLTELSDGVFVACCFNHILGDGTSYWQFFNAWAKIARSKEGEFTITRPVINNRWFIDGESPPVILPFSHADDFMDRYMPPPLREKIFHFSSQSIAQLKAKANSECDTNTISSFQALSSLIWRFITRARRLPPDQQTSCRLAIENRSRLRPPLPPDYFGNSIYAVAATATAGELMAHGLGWAALLVHQAVAAYTDNVIRELIRKNHENEKPFIVSSSMFDRYSVMMGSSPRFNMYGCDFGWGKAVALRSGAANKFEGKVTSYPGWEGGGSIDLEVCLLPEHMAALELDEEFMAAVSSPHYAI